MFSLSRQLTEVDISHTFSSEKEKNLDVFNYVQSSNNSNSQNTNGDFVYRIWPVA